MAERKVVKSCWPIRCAAACAHRRRRPAGAAPARPAPGHASPARGGRPGGTDSAARSPKSGRENRRPPAPQPGPPPARAQMRVQRLGQPERVPVAGQVAHGPPAPWHARPHRCAPQRRCRVRAGFQLAPAPPRPPPAPRAGPGLPLPAREGAAVIFDLKRIAWAWAVRVSGSRRGCDATPRRPYPLPPPPAYLVPQGSERRAACWATIADGMTRGVEGACLDRVRHVLRAGDPAGRHRPVARGQDRVHHRAGREPDGPGADAAACRAQPRGGSRRSICNRSPTDTVPRFDYEAHLAALTGDDPRWPASTRAISELRLSFRVQPVGLFAALGGPRTVHLDIVDYPGEWLLDLALLDKTYADWSEDTLARHRQARRRRATSWPMARAEDGALQLDEARAQALAGSFTAYLTAAREAGCSDCTPGRFLLPGDLAGSPVLTFAPLPQPADTPRGSLWREMERRYRGLQARGRAALLPRPFRPDRPAGRAGRCAGRDPCRAAARWRTCAARWPRSCGASGPGGTPG